ncbi:MAG TPA: imidazolonepropionase [Caldithrix abyssi]|uniref:Imidazolonepropionase n=1 Tax=Caldithrix abyssi TaxID=187145 RepID=A0A7V4TYF5_CALAY|nr:imidazolonepropionase [Caldithrix abyssi]
MSLLISNIGRIYSPDTEKSYGSVKEWRNVSLLVEDGKIIRIIPAGEKSATAEEIIDAGGQTVLPGFVDAHTHPVFWLTREDEFIMRVQGKSYEEIAAAGGGIRNSVRRFRQAGKEEIKEVTRRRLKRFFEYGTTTIEAKSGYGLSTEDEIKSLEIINELNRELDLDLIPTFLGAHEVPDEYQSDRAAYIRLLKEEMIPLVAEDRLARYCDVFCEKGVFTVEESREILQAGQQAGLGARVHADELHPFGGAEMAAEIGAVTADHLVQTSDRGIAAMAEAGVIPVLLPGTTFFLGKNDYARAREMIEAGCEVAVSTDFNPGSSTTQNMQLMWTIGALKLKMMPGELLWATTITAAKSLNLDEQIGTVEEGKQADLIVLDIPNLNYLPYHYGVNHVLTTIKKGKVVYKRNDC